MKTLKDNKKPSKITPIFTLFLLIAVAAIFVPSSILGLKQQQQMLLGRMSSQAQLVDYLQRTHAFRSARVRKVLLAVDRADFAPSHPYEDRPQYIGQGATISAPHMHAAALVHLDEVIGENAHVLDVGSGSGYLAACLAKLVGPGGRVVGVDHIDQLVNQSIRNVRKNHAELLDSGRLQLVVGDGRLGWPAEAPYQAIHVGAAAAELPQALVDQFAIGGRMVIPVGRYSQKFLQVDKQPDGSISQRRLADVIYVPLTSKQQQIGSDRDGSL